MRRLILSALLLIPFMMNAQSTKLPGNFVHSVYFWLKNPENQSDRQEFLQALNTFISSSKYITSYHIAPPAGTPREVVDNTYTFNLIATFETAELQDLYQKEDVHLKFIEDASHLWERVQIYDSYPGMALPATYRRPDIQIGVVVSDLQRSVNFYTNVLGMVQSGGFSIDQDFGKKSGLSNGVPFDVVILKTSDTPAAAEWKLMSFDPAGTKPASSFIQEATGMRYITLFVNDMDSILKRLDAAGIKRNGETPVTLPDGNRFVLIQDPDGIFIELIGK